MEMAVQLCCLQIKCFFREVPQMSLEKKSSLEYLEREVHLLFLCQHQFSVILLCFCSYPDWTQQIPTLLYTRIDETKEFTQNDPATI